MVFMSAYKIIFVTKVNDRLWFNDLVCIIAVGVEDNNSFSTIESGIWAIIDLLYLNIFKTIFTKSMEQH